MSEPKLTLYVAGEKAALFIDGERTHFGTHTWLVDYKFNPLVEFLVNAAGVSVIKVDARALSSDGLVVTEERFVQERLAKIEEIDRLRNEAAKLDRQALNIQRGLER